MEPGRQRCEGWAGLGGRGKGQGEGHSLQPDFSHLKGHLPGLPPSATTATLLRGFGPSEELA